MKRILLIKVYLLLLLGCNQPMIYNQYDTNALPTVSPKLEGVESFPAIFETAFFPTTQVIEDTVKLSFYQKFIGNLKIESGKIIACDAVSFHDQPFTQTFPIGNFPVELAIAQLQEDERVAFARILFSSKPVKKWEMALLKGQSPLPVEGEEIYGYGVDAGIGLFLDVQSQRAFDQLLAHNSKAWEAIFIDETHKNYKDTWDWTLYEYESHTLAAFSTGAGDGAYQTYIGLDENGQVCRLLTDFQLVNWVKNKKGVPPTLR